MLLYAMEIHGVLDLRVYLYMVWIVNIIVEVC